MAGVAATVWALVLGWLPIAAGGLLALAGEFFAAVGGGLAVASAWFKSASDESHEKVAWAVASLLGVGLAVYWVHTSWAQTSFFIKGVVAALALSVLVVVVSRRSE